MSGSDVKVYPESSDRTTARSRFWQPLVPALYVGAATGTGGAIYGTLQGTLKQSQHPRLWTTLAAAQWFATGTTFFYCRSLLLQETLSKDNKWHRVAASGFAGGCAGAVAAAHTAPRRSLAGFIMLGSGAVIGQGIVNLVQGSTAISKLSTGFGSRISSISPMRSLSDKEYEDLLQDKLLKIEAEISLLDEQIIGLRATKQDAWMHQSRPA